MKQEHMHGGLKEYIRENLAYVMIPVFIVDINKQRIALLIGLV